MLTIASGIIVVVVVTIIIGTDVWCCWIKLPAASYVFVKDFVYLIRM